MGADLRKECRQDADSNEIAGKSQLYSYEDIHRPQFRYRERERLARRRFDHDAGLADFADWTILPGGE